MAFIVKKKIGNKDYFYLNENKRVDGKVKTKTLAYLGKTKKDAEEKMKEILERGKAGEIRITYFVHGTTTDNENGISTGQNQGELSELGIKQSKELQKQIGNKIFDVAFCSDLKRAVDSAEITFGKKYKIIRDKRLRECDYGKLNGADEKEIVYENHIKEPFPNGESLMDVEKRISDFLNYLFDNYAGKNIAIVSHKSPQLAMEVLLNKKTWEEAIKTDWRKTGKWQPGWNYKMKEKLEDKIKEESPAEKSESMKISIDEMAVFCKRKGFIYPSSEIYGGFSGFWDFGPTGSEMFNNLKQEWWKFFVQRRKDMVGIEASIISHPKTWEASGHVESFGDLVLECSNDNCGNRLRADHFVEDTLKINADGMKSEQINELIKKNNLKCPKCKKDFRELKSFNLLFKTNVGAKEGSSSAAFLRGETAQGMFMNFKNVVDSSRVKLPFGIAQLGRCFRNEIAPRDFLFRSREFSIGEFEFFINPEEKKCGLLDGEHLKVKFRLLDSETQEAGKKDVKNTSIWEILKSGKLNEWHAYWLAEQLIFFERIGLDLKKIKIREHVKTELSHYSSATFDIDYEFPFGSKEIAGNANRGQFDLKQHMKYSNSKLEIFDEASKKSIIPRVIEPTFGMERVFLALMTDAYNYDKKRENIVLKLNPKISPVKAAIFPIVKKEEFDLIAKKIFDDLREEWKVSYDESGSIGRRYARNDEIGTPFCITIDDESVTNNDATIRDRDTTKQIRVKIPELKEVLRKLISMEIEFEKAGKIVK